ncbi:MAG: flagellar hook-associated protein FlgK [Beijerinckiaceae bacterium]|jgi:flagellar hook-associated protein 1 FlgK|nr:flagellar hook-associated protein FlgK [Beijerinckiaceae bacterium]
MGLLSALSNAVSGLTVNQSQMEIISRNVANKNTVGYNRRILRTQETSATGITAGAVREISVDRMLDTLIQKQLRTEASGGGYSATRADYLSRVDSMFGQPGSSIGINQIFADFSTAMQQLAADPASPTTRQEVLAKAQSLAAGISSLSGNVQAMRAEIEARIANDAQKANGLLDGIERTTKRLNEVFDDATRQGLLDERDRYIDELSNYFDLRTFDNGTGNFNIYTTSGGPLFIEGRSLRIQFDGRFAVNANSTYDPNPAVSTLGRLVMADPIGSQIDLSRNGLVKSGSMAALFDLRDRILVETQAHLDEFAAAITTSLGDRTIAGTAVTVGPQQGFNLDLNALQSGNVATLEYTIQPAGTRQKVSFIAVNNPGALPLPAGATADPNDLEFGIDFSGGMAAAITAIGTALGAPFTVNNLGAGVVQILDDGAGNTRDINGLSARATVTGLTDQGMALPFFVDGNAGSQLYTGSFDSGSQKRGYSTGIRVNPALLADPSRLVVYDTILPGTTAAGDPARPSFLRDQLQSWETDFTPAIALTGSTAIYRGTASQFLDRVIAAQTQASSNAEALSEGQEVILSTLRERASAVSGVNTDQELADLVEIQNIYAANARIISSVKDMFDALMRI